MNRKWEGFAGVAGGGRVGGRDGYFGESYGALFVTVLCDVGFLWYESGITSVGDVGGVKEQEMYFQKRGAGEGFLVCLVRTTLLQKRVG